MPKDIAELLECGIIVACDSDMGIAIVANGAYLLLYRWMPAGRYTPAMWTNTDCQARPKDMWETSAANIWDEGKAYLASILEGGE